MTHNEMKDIIAREHGLEAKSTIDFFSWCDTHPNATVQQAFATFNYYYFRE